MRSITFPGFPPKILITFLLRRSTCFKGGRGEGVVKVAILDCCVVLKALLWYTVVCCYVWSTVKCVGPVQYGVEWLLVAVATVDVDTSTERRVK